MIFVFSGTNRETEGQLSSQPLAGWVFLFLSSFLPLVAAAEPAFIGNRKHLLLNGPQGRNHSL